MEKLLFFGGIFVLNFLLIHSEFLHFRQYHNCKSSNYGNICDPKSEKPCSNPDLVCKLTDLMNKIFTCTDKVQLGHYCEVDEDCNKYIPSAECSKQKKCACKSNSIQTSKTSCSPLLGELCMDNQTCKPDNSICFDNLCQCDDFYLPLGNFKCLPSLLGTYCDNNIDCEGIKHAKCSDEHFCICEKNTVQINPSRCVTRPKFICESHSQCEENKFCINYECRCKPGFHLGPDNECVSVHLGVSCKSDEDCSNLIRHSICSAEKKCKCDRFHYPTQNSLCASIINDSCKDTELCKNEFTLCLDDECQCQPNHVYNGSKCIPVLKN